MAGPFNKLFNSDFGKTATLLEKGMNMINPIDPMDKSANSKRQIATMLGSAAINFLPKLAGMKEGGKVKKMRKGGKVGRPKKAKKANKKK
tara:strand:- start:382 stop:651 length:270 start_codon:yes stop_codon:yes gene_type:complete